MTEVCVRKASYWVGLLTIVLSVAATAHAGNAVVPEIDGGSLATGLGLLSGGLLILRSRWRAK